ncbi:MAG: lysylphosphatidylglycerol synthase transmembrane domain-containing protein [Thermoleophilaceae bacterium]
MTSLLRGAGQALELIVDKAVAVNPWWVLAGVALYQLSQVIRTRGWFNIIRAAYPGETELRARDVAGAYMAGVGVNAVVPARGGDVLKLLLVHRKLPASRYSTLAATFLPETLFETVVGIGLVIWMLAHGFLPVPTTATELPSLDVSFIASHPILSAVGGVILAAALTLAFRWMRCRSRDLIRRLKQGLSILRTPRDFVTGVASWQALSRIVRLGALVCFMRAFGLPVTPQTAVLVMAAQGAGRIVPLAPVSAGLRVALLSYGFVEVTDKSVDVASITAFWFGVGAANLLAGLAISLGVIGSTLSAWSPRRALAAARSAAVPETPAPEPSA